MIGIYKIENLINHKVYIGQSVNIERRWIDHRCGYQFADEVHLYRAMQKYGINNFSFTVIEQCKKEELNDKEKYWIKFYNSIDRNNGYNRTVGGTDSVHCLLTDKQIDQIYEMLRNNISQSDIAEKFNVTQQLISSINLGISYVRDNIEYPIVNNRAEKVYCIDCGKEIGSNSTRCRKCEGLYRKNNSHIREIITREELKFKIRNQSFVSIGKEYGISDNGIRKWCQNYNLPFKKKEINSYSNEEWDNL